MLVVKPSSVCRQGILVHSSETRYSDGTKINTLAYPHTIHPPTCRPPFTNHSVVSAATLAPLNPKAMLMRAVATSPHPSMLRAENLAPNTPPANLITISAGDTLKANMLVKASVAMRPHPSMLRAEIRHPENPALQTGLMNDAQS